MKAPSTPSAMHRTTVTVIICLLLVAPAASSLHLVIRSERECLKFLDQYMPEKDKQLLDHGFLIRNVNSAQKARELTPWGLGVPWNLFLNDVLPYAVLNEQRDDWREFFFNSLSPLLVESTSIDCDQHPHLEAMESHVCGWPNAADHVPFSGAAGRQCELHWHINTAR
jgi:hypothetical protein